MAARHEIRLLIIRKDLRGLSSAAPRPRITSPKKIILFMHLSKKLSLAFLVVASMSAASAASFYQQIAVDTANVSYSTPGVFSLDSNPNNLASSSIDVSTVPTLASIAYNSFGSTPGFNTSALNSLTYSFSVSGPTSAIIPISISGLIEMAVARNGAQAFAESVGSINALGQTRSSVFTVNGLGQSNGDATSSKARYVDGNYDFYLREYGEVGPSTLSELISFEITGFVATNQNYFVQLLSSARTIVPYNVGQSAVANASITSSIALGAGFQDAALYSINVESGIGNGAGPGGSSVPDSVPTLLLLLVPVLGFALSRKRTKAVFAE